MYVGDSLAACPQGEGEHWRDGRIFRWVSIKHAPTGSVVYSHRAVVCKCDHVCVMMMMHRSYETSFVTGRGRRSDSANDRKKNNLTPILDALIVNAHYLTLEAMTSAFIILKNSG